MAGESQAHDNARRLLQPLMDRLPSGLAGAPDVVKYDVMSEENGGFVTVFEFLPMVACVVWSVCLLVVVVAVPFYLYYLRTPSKNKKGLPLLGKDVDDEMSEQLDLTSIEPDMHFLTSVIKELRTEGLRAD